VVVVLKVPKKELLSQLNRLLKKLHHKLMSKVCDKLKLLLVVLEVDAKLLSEPYKVVA
jgi:hypothetical protein